MNDGMEDELGVTTRTSPRPSPIFVGRWRSSRSSTRSPVRAVMFRSAKGLLDSTQPASYYPPRADLFNFGGTPCLAAHRLSAVLRPGRLGAVLRDERRRRGGGRHAPLRRAFTGSWIVPADLAGGDYAWPSRWARSSTPTPPTAPQRGERAGHAVLPRRRPARERRPAIGPVSGAVHPRRRCRGGHDQRHRRLRRLERHDGRREAARRHHQQRPGQRGGAAAAHRQRRRRAGTGGADAGQPVPRSTAPPRRRRFRCRSRSPPRRPRAAPASGGVLQSSETGGQPVVGYDVRYAILPPNAAIDASAFSAWTPAGGLPSARLGRRPPSRSARLTPLTTYGVGISAIGVCGSSPPTFQTFSTPAIPYTKLSGCFIATAAFGSDLAPRGRHAARPARRRDRPERAGDDGGRPLLPLVAAAGQRPRALPVGRALVRAALRSHHPLDTGGFLIA